MIYRIEEAKGMSKVAGNWIVKRKGKLLRYFTDKAEAEFFVQFCIEADRCHEQEA